MTKRRFDYDFAIIGGGSAGYNAARVAAQHGLRAVVIDGAKDLGGLCILRGCMPSKTLLYSAEVLHRAQEGRRFGLKIPSARADLPALRARKRRIIAEFAADRVKGLIGGKFDLVRAYARFVDPHTVELSHGGTLRAKKFLIATGSRASWPDVPGLRESKPWTSDDILDYGGPAGSVAVLGGGLVAVELAQYMARTGFKVTVIQRGKEILREHSSEAATVLAGALEADGIRIATGTALERVERVGKSKGFTITYRHHGRKRSCRVDYCLNALGRQPDTAGLGLQAAGVKADERGQIGINRFQQTNVPHIYAAGDCSGPVEIVHIAVRQGEIAGEHAARGTARPIDFSHLLCVVFTDPQVATIGRTGRELTEKKIPFLAASYPFDDHGKSILMEAKRGYVKVFAAPKSGRLLGAEIVGPDAGELIHIFTAPLTLKATVFDLLKAPWYHPTLSEIVTYPLEEIAEKIL